MHFIDFLRGPCDVLSANVTECHNCLCTALLLGDPRCSNQKTDWVIGVNSGYCSKGLVLAGAEFILPFVERAELCLFGLQK